MATWKIDGNMYIKDTKDGAAWVESLGRGSARYGVQDSHGDLWDNGTEDTVGHAKQMAEVGLRQLKRRRDVTLSGCSCSRKK